MKIGIIGINGRMGKSVAKAVLANDLNDISGGLVRLGSNIVGKDIGKIIGAEDLGIAATDNLEELVKSSDVVIDFSNPDLSLQLAELNAKHGKILICGTTGFSNEQKITLRNHGQSGIIVWGSNMSIGINLLMNLAEQVAETLHGDFDAEVLEMHHKNKVDAPSGTALSLGKAVAKGRGLNFGEVSRKAREGIIGKRSENEIGFAALRGGDVIGDHSVIFAGPGERIELTHKASNRDIYANGAIRAAIWAVGKPNGFYTMQDVLK